MRAVVCTLLNRVVWASLFRDIGAKTDALKELSGWWGAAGRGQHSRPREPLGQRLSGRCVLGLSGKL